MGEFGDRIPSAADEATRGSSRVGRDGASVAWPENTLRSQLAVHVFTSFQTRLRSPQEPSFASLPSDCGQYTTLRPDDGPWWPSPVPETRTPTSALALAGCDQLDWLRSEPVACVGHGSEGVLGKKTSEQVSAAPSAVGAVLIASVILTSVGFCSLSQEIRVESEEERYAPPAVADARDTSDLPPGLAQSVQRSPDELVELPGLLRPPQQTQDECGECKRLQVSVQRDVPDFPPGTWRHIAEEAGPGSWRIVIHSPEAVFIRARLELDPGEKPPTVFFYGEAGTESLEGPFSSRTLDATGGWGPIIGGESLYIEVITGSSKSPPLLTVPEISHGYRPIPPFERVGPCHNDVTCYSGWSDASRAVARIYFQSKRYGWVCTGALLADTDASTQRFWFLTAQHCVSSDAVADTLIAAFDYTTSTCNGSAPYLWEASFAYGSDYVVGSTISDFTLLELDQNPPGRQTFLGWSTGDLSSGEEIVTVHHPGGSHQRITFGNENGSGVAWPYWNEFWRVVYHSGSTEGGSSGAPLFDEAGQYVRGQLWGGNASCWYMSGIDLYGKLGTSWNLGLSNHLFDSTAPPQPDPMTWDTAPQPAAPNAIKMTATTATYPSGVEYFFEETSGNSGGTDSGWQEDPSYTDSGLQDGALYCYRVKARGKPPGSIETGWSTMSCSPPGIRGDIDGNSSTDLIDVLMLYRHVEGGLLLAPEALARADVDEDGDVDADDAQALANLVFAT